MEEGDRGGEVEGGGATAKSGPSSFAVAATEQTPAEAADAEGDQGVKRQGADGAAQVE